MDGVRAFALTPYIQTHEKQFLDNGAGGFILRRTMNTALITTCHSYSEPAVAGAGQARAGTMPDAVIRVAFFRFNEEKHEPMR